jgi:hypothetical protein
LTVTQTRAEQAARRRLIHTGGAMTLPSGGDFLFHIIRNAYDEAEAEGVDGINLAIERMRGLVNDIDAVLKALEGLR